MRQKGRPVTPGKCGNRAGAWGESSPLKFVQLVGGWDSVAVLEQYVRRMSSDDALGGNIKWQ